jgi:hypothetical protein
VIYKPIIVTARINSHLRMSRHTSRASAYSDALQDPLQSPRARLSSGSSGSELDFLRRSPRLSTSPSSSGASPKKRLSTSSASPENSPFKVAKRAILTGISDIHDPVTGAATIHRRRINNTSIPPCDRVYHVRNGCGQFLTFDMIKDLQKKYNMKQAASQLGVSIETMKRIKHYFEIENWKDKS